ncbi:DUF4166 domain-containing protein [Frondihabitans cladoniiphilus]|uniref:DUF4166 domain-containing protein n=1 Tax=Frondihabitans cladoniiphilus TaxID=715785 RepID=A0ABP8VVF8_9MICO
MPSPYEIALGPALDGLHPRLRAYFGEIPPGSVGRGEGVFASVGTPRRWLWPVLSVLGRQGILFAAWASDVPFTVTNRPLVDADGNTAVGALRTFVFASGSRTMTDAITATPTGLVDVLGIGRRLEAPLRARVDGGALRLTSHGVTVALGGRRLRLPGWLSPRVELTERFDDETERQQVSLTLEAPLVGRLYEYEGRFTYTVVPSEQPGSEHRDHSS